MLGGLISRLISLQQINYKSLSTAKLLQLFFNKFLTIPYSKNFVDKRDE